MVRLRNLLARHPRMSFVLFALGILFLRRPDAFLRPQFWAEDFVFLVEAEKFGWKSFSMPMAGYLHLVPRTLAYLTSYLDPFIQPGVFVGVSILISIGVGLTCMSKRLDPKYGIFLAAAIVLVPHTGEVYFNPTNVQWFVALGLMMTSQLRDPTNRREWLADLLYLIGGGLSGPFVIFVLPFFLYRLYQRRTLASAALAIGAMILATLQVWLIISWRASEAVPDTVDWWRMFTIAFNRTFGATLLGAHTARLVPAIMVSIALIVGLFLSWRILREDGHRRGVLLRLALFAGAILASTAWLKRLDVWGYGDLSNGDRYFFLPNLILLSLLGYFATKHWRSWPGWAACALVISSFGLNAARFRFEPKRESNWYANCAEIRAGGMVYVVVGPNWAFKYKRGSIHTFGPTLHQDN